MYKLFYSPGACSMAVHVVLNELGAEFTLDKRSTKDGALKTPEFLKINPRGQVPVLETEGEYIKEGAAILIYLLDKHKSPLLPRDGIERAHALEWLCWANATLHGAYSRAFWVGKSFAGKPYQADVAAPALEQIQLLWDEAQERLKNTKYLAGDFVSAADILLAVIANWNQWIERDFNIGPDVKRVIRDVVARPSYQKALAVEQVEYKAAA